jgi:hypothetical protein
VYDDFVLYSHGNFSNNIERSVRVGLSARTGEQSLRDEGSCVDRWLGDERAFTSQPNPLGFKCDVSRSYNWADPNIESQGFVTADEDWLTEKFDEGITFEYNGFRPVSTYLDEDHDIITYNHPLVSEAEGLREQNQVDQFDYQDDNIQYHFAWWRTRTPYTDEIVREDLNCEPGSTPAE